MISTSRRVQFQARAALMSEDFISRKREVSRKELRGVGAVLRVMKERSSGVDACAVMRTVTLPSNLSLDCDTDISPV